MNVARLQTFIDRSVERSFSGLTIQSAGDIIASGQGDNITIGRQGGNAGGGSPGPTGPTGPGGGPMGPSGTTTGPTGPTGPAGPPGESQLSSFNASGNFTEHNFIAGVCFSAA